MALDVDAIVAGLDPAERRKIEDMAARLIAEELTLRELRKARELTRASLARELGIGEDGVSRLEQRSDLLLSTFRKMVEALGGSLPLVVRFPDRPRSSSPASLNPAPATGVKAASLRHPGYGLRGWPSGCPAAIRASQHPARWIPPRMTDAAEFRSRKSAIASDGDGVRRRVLPASPTLQNGAATMSRSYRLTAATEHRVSDDIRPIPYAHDINVIDFIKDNVYFPVCRSVILMRCGGPAW